MFAHLSFLSTPFAVRAARPRKKYSAAKNYEFEKKKQPISHEGVSPFVLTTQVLQNPIHMDARHGEWRGRAN